MPAADAPQNVPKYIAKREEPIYEIMGMIAGQPRDCLRRQHRYRCQRTRETFVQDRRRSLVDGVTVVLFSQWRQIPAGRRGVIENTYEFDASHRLNFIQVFESQVNTIMDRSTELIMLVADNSSQCKISPPPPPPPPLPRAGNAPPGTPPPFTSGREAPGNPQFEILPGRNPPTLFPPKPLL